MFALIMVLALCSPVLLLGTAQPLDHSVAAAVPSPEAVQLLACLCVPDAHRGVTAAADHLAAISTVAHILHAATPTACHQHHTGQL